MVVSDDKLGPITSFTGDGNGNSALDPGETWTYNKTATALADQQTNLATVTAQDVNTAATVTDDNPANYFGEPPAINIVKLTNCVDSNTAPGPVVAVGSTVTFTYVVTNPGSLPLSGVTVRDDNGTAANPADDFNPTFVGGDTNGNGVLDLTETWTYTVTKIARPVSTRTSRPLLALAAVCRFCR